MLNKIKENSVILLISLAIIYFAFNLLDGDRGLISQIKKENKLEFLKYKEVEIVNKIEDFKLKNSLLTTNLYLDYIETLIRDKFIFGKKGETIYMINQYEN